MLRKMAKSAFLWREVHYVAPFIFLFTAFMAYLFDHPYLTYLGWFAAGVYAALYAGALNALRKIIK